MSTLADSKQQKAASFITLLRPVKQRHTDLHTYSSTKWCLEDRNIREANCCHHQAQLHKCFSPKFIDNNTKEKQEEGGSPTEGDKHKNPERGGGGRLEQHRN